jgi:hypothetical protein
MSIICNKYQSTRDMHWHADLNMFICEASDLGRLGPFDGRVYDDACDTGFILVSHVTGDAMLFVNDGHDLNGDEIAGWRYKADRIADRAGVWRKLPAHLNKITALIIND